MTAALNDQSGNSCAAGVASLISGVPDPFNQMSEGMSMEWKDQYKHPNWQKKRLEALEAADFTCERCTGEEKQLHVHHKRYVKGRMIWEYSIDELEVLCDTCHEDAHAFKDELQAVLSGVCSDSLPIVIGLLAGFFDVNYGATNLDGAAAFDSAYALPIGKVARVVHDRLGHVDAERLSEAIKAHKRSKDGNTVISFEVGPQIGFVDE